MFSLKIVDTDEFLDMPPTTQNLYFHLCMRADDDGFVSSPKKIMKIINSADDDMKVLIGKRFVIPFDSGVCVIKHWKIHNLIRQDRYTETEYKEEKNLLIEKDNKYKLNSGKPNDNQMTTKCQHRLGKDRLGKERKEERGLSPSEEMILFLEDEAFFTRVVEHWATKLKSTDIDIIKVEILAFINYWAEENDKGKQRWQLEKTFELNRRLAKWFKNKIEWSAPGTKVKKRVMSTTF